MPTLKVTLNSTSENHWHKMGLTQNPFPQIGKAEYDAGERVVASLDGDPIKNEADLRKRLQGFSAEFVGACLANFKIGERVSFTVHWPD